MAGKYLDDDGLLYFWGKLKAYIGSTIAGVSGVKGDAEANYRTGNVNLTKGDLGLGNVEDKSSATIRGEMTGSDVTTALGYTPPQQDTDTHRPIKVNGTQNLGNNTTPLNLKNGSNVSITASGGDVTIEATDTTDLTQMTGVLPVAKGGTGSSSKNFVDLSSDQTVAGRKTFSTVPYVQNTNPGYVAKETNSQDTVVPDNDSNCIGFRILDKNDVLIMLLTDWFGSNGQQGMQIMGRRNGVANTLRLVVDANGNRVVVVSDAVPWRKALGLGTNGALPITIAQGGTGLTASPSMLTNLESTSAANVLQASPRPGITGTLAIGHGGTGQNGLVGLAWFAKAGANFTVTSATGYQWGKMVQVDVAVKCTTAVTATTGTIVFTINNAAIRPCLDINCPDSANARTLWRTNGNVQTFKTIAKDATLSFRACYLVP